MFLSKSLRASLIITLVGSSLLAPALALDFATRFRGNALQSRLDYYSGVKVVLSSKRSTYYQGEVLELRYEIDCDSSQQNPFPSHELIAGLVLLSNSAAVECEKPAPSSSYSRQGGASTHFGGSFEVTGGFGPKVTEEQFGFRQLLPGHYVGFFDYGYITPAFEFDVMPVPDSLTHIWEASNRIRRFLTKKVSSSPSDILHDCLVSASILKSSTRGGPWRSYALTTACFVCGFYKDIWSEQDSLDCVEILSDVAHDKDVPEGKVVLAAASSIFKGMRSDELTTGLENWSRRFPREKLHQATVKYVEQIRSRERDNGQR